MPTVAAYREGLERARAAGDNEAVRYFEGQISKGLGEDPARKTKGSILDPLAQGLTFGFADELAGVGGGIASSLMGEGFSKGYNTVTGDARERLNAYNERHPYVGLGAEIGSGLVLPLGAIRSGVSGLRTALKSGAAYGAGTANTGNEKLEGDAVSVGDLGDRALGTGAGAAAGAVGHGAISGLRGLGRWGFGRASRTSRQRDFRGKVQALERAGIHVNAPEALADMNTRQSYEALRRATLNRDDRPFQLYSHLMQYASGRGYGFTPRYVADGELSREAVENATARFTSAYNTALRGVNVSASQMAPNINRVLQMRNRLLPHEVQATNAAVDDLWQRVQQGNGLTGRDYKRLRSMYGDRANKLRDNAAYPGMRQVFRELRQALDDSFRAAATPAQQARLRELDTAYGPFKLLQQASENPSAIGTFVNRARKNRHRLPDGFTQLAEAYQDVILRGYPRSSMTPEGMAFGNLALMAQHGLRASTAPMSRAYENARNRVIPGHYQRAPRRRAAIAAGQRYGAPVADYFSGGLPFTIGQQAPNSLASTLPDAFLGYDN